MTDVVARFHASPDRAQSFLDGSSRSVVTLGGLRIGRGEYRPGWQWSIHAGPQTGRSSAAHLGYVVSGAMAVRAPDGDVVELGPGDAFQVGPGNDAWVLGEQPCIALDFAATEPAAADEPVDDDAVADAVRWLRRSYRAGAAVDLLAAAGMAVPALYGPTLRMRRGFRRSRPEFAYAMRTGAPLMLGWTLLLLWGDREPLARRGVLPITIAPVIAGLMANDAHAARTGWIAKRGVVPVRLLQLALVTLFGGSYLKAERALVGSRR